MECTLEELAVLELISKNPSMKQKELVTETGKSLSTIKYIMESLQKNEYIRRVDGKRYGEKEEPNVVIIELKQWDKVEAVEVEGGQK